MDVAGRSGGAERRGHIAGMKTPGGTPAGGRRAWLLCAALYPWVAGCGGDAARTAGGAEVVRGGTASFGVPAAATTVLPPLAAAALDFDLGSLSFAGLNYAVWADGRLEYPQGHPLALARSWTYGADGERLTYRIDPERVWSDGTPVTATDVVFTFDLLADESLNLPLSGTTAHIDSVAADDDRTVTFFFDHAYPGALFDTGVGILPAHIYGGLDRAEMHGIPGFDAAPPGTPLVGSGPFLLETWQPGERAVFVRNPVGTVSPVLDRLEIRVLPDETVRIAALRNGEIDVAQLNSHRPIARLRAEGYRIERVPQRGYDFIAWNPAGHPAFADRRVREALSVAIDREALIDGLDMRGFAEPAWGPYGSLFPRLATPSPHDPPFDPAGARALLDGAGWADGDGDGIRERGADRLSFTLETAAGNERRESAAQILQSQFAAVGAEARIRTEEFSSLLGRAMGGDYEAALLGWQVGLDPDISPFFGDPASPLNVVGFDDPGVQALLDSALAQPRPEDAERYWRDAGRRIAAGYPYAFLWFFDFPIAVGPGVSAVDVDVFGPLASAHRWAKTAVDR